MSVEIVEESDTAVTRTRDYQVITTMEEATQLRDKLLSDGKLVSFDIETSYNSPKAAEKRSLDVYHPDFFVVGFSITNDPSWSRYIPLRHENEQPFVARDIWELFRPVLEGMPLLAHNMQFEGRALSQLAVKGDADSPIVPSNIHDSMILSHVLGENRSHALKKLSQERLGVDQKEFISLFEGKVDPDTGKKITKKNMRYHRLSITPDVVSYACDDTALALELYMDMLPRLDEGQLRMYKIELQICRMMLEVADFGVGVDWDGISTAYERYESFRDSFDAVVRDGFAERTTNPEDAAFARGINFGSPAQMRDLLYERLGLSTTRETKSGALSTDAVALEKLSREESSIRALLSLREIDNLGRRCRKWINEYYGSVDNRVHPVFSQTQVISGRFSADSPALQQLGKHWLWSLKRDEDGNYINEGVNGVDYWEGNFRNFIIARPGRYLATYDYGQAELRVLAGITQEPTLLEAFDTGADPHTLTAAIMLNKDPVDVTKDERQVGKTCIAEGQLVLTDKGEVPIEQVTLDHKVWDGEQWVTHDGVIYQGVREVLTAHGLTATPDHKVFMKDGSKVAWEHASTRRDDIARGIANRPCGLYDPRGWDIQGRTTPEVQGEVPEVWEDVRSSTQSRSDSGRDSSASEAEGRTFARVYDIVNAGPEHRFTVSGYVVANCSFGLLYGMGPKTLGERLAVSTEQAREYMDTYLSQFKRVSAWNSSSKSMGVNAKYVRTWLGRKIPLWDAYDLGNSMSMSKAERLAVNAQIQGGAADYTKLAMLRSKAVLQQAGLWHPDKVMLTMNQHDSLTFEVDNSVDPNELRDILNRAVMFNPKEMFPSMYVPDFPAFDVDWELGITWGGAASWDADKKAVWVEEADTWVVEGAEPEKRPTQSTEKIIFHTDEPEDTTLPIVNFIDPAPDKEPTPEPKKRTFTIVVEKTVTQPQLAELVKTLRDFPGNNDVFIQLGEESLPVTGTTGRTPDDETLFKVALGTTGFEIFEETTF